MHLSEMRKPAKEMSLPFVNFLIEMVTLMSAHFRKTHAM